MEKTTLYIPADLQRRLRDAARRARRPQAALVREALDAYLDAQARPRPKSIGMADDPGLRAEDAKVWVRSRWEER